MLTHAEQISRTTTKLFSDFIAAKGLNMSSQRMLILKAFLSEGPRISIDELYIKLRHLHPTLGRSTVYRTLKLIAECGIARAIVMDGINLHYEKNSYLCAAHESPIHGGK